MVGSQVVDEIIYELPGIMLCQIERRQNRLSHIKTSSQLIPHAQQ